MYYLELAGEDDRFALAEAALACADTEHLAPGIARARSVDAALAGRLALTRAVLAAAGSTGGGLDDLVAAVTRWDLDRAGSVAVRATSVRGRGAIDPPAVERRVGTVLVERGMTVDLEDPDHVFRVLATGDGERRWYCGWVEVEPARAYGARRPANRPFRQPGTMRPQLARTLVNLSGVRAGEVLLDPMCGAGAILVEAGLVGARPVGVDVQVKMLRGTRANVEAFAPAGHPPLLVRGTAAALPIGRAHAAVFDAPYGRQSPIGFATAPALVEASLTELVDVVDRCVVVFDRPIDPHAVAAGWEVADRFERRVHRSLTRHVAVLDHPR